MASFAGPPEGLEISEDMPVNEMADRIYEYWKSNSFIKFVENVGNTMKPILLDAGGYPNEKYKDFLSYFAFNYEQYPKAFITTLFMTALEENSITGIIRIVANKHDLDLVQPLSKEKVYEDSDLLTKLKELNTIIPTILKNGKRVYGTQAKNAVISNSIIVLLNAKRPDIIPIIPISTHTLKRKRKRNNNNNNNKTNKNTNRKLAWQGGTRKRGRKSKILKKHQ
jgi:hypothetical protein